MQENIEADLQYLLGFFNEKFSKKFRRGAEKYAGTPQDLKNLSPIRLLYEALDENLDQFSYLVEAIIKLEQEQ